MTQRTQYINQMINMLHSGDIDAFVDLFTSNAEMILPKAYCVGSDAIRNAVVELFERYEIEIELERVQSQGSVVLVQWRWRDRNRLTDKRNITDTAIVLEFRGSRINRWREYHAPVLIS